MEKKKIHANERTRPTIVLLSRKLGEEDVRGQNDDPCVDHLREWMQKKNKKNKRKDIFQKRKRIKEEEEEKKKGGREMYELSFVTYPSERMLSWGHQSMEKY